MSKEMVEHPSHYKKEGRKECIEEMVDLFGESAVAIWCALNHYKYNYRKGTKENNSEQQDVQKGIWYLNYTNKLKKDLVPDNIVEYINKHK